MCFHLNANYTEEMKFNLHQCDCLNTYNGFADFDSCEAHVCFVTKLSI